ncbi:replication initiation protein [Spirosoma flavum]|uniref:Replication initiation protein n=1 Tax=Spirosoma flavum TaxID=2048557 RepID=A0ABW6AQM5_9BACT
MKKRTPTNQLSLLNYARMSAILFQGNALTTAHYDMTALQKNILYMVQSQLGAEDAPGKEYLVRVRDIMGLTSTKNPYEDLRKSTETMMQKIMTIAVPDGFIQVAPFSSVQYNTKEGTIAICIDSKLRPYLFNLDNRFTTYGLTEAMNVPGKYSKRLYEMLSQWKSMGLMKVNMPDLRLQLKLEDKYPDWDNFKRRVLDPAVAEINQHTDLFVKYYPERESRRIALLKWTIKLKSTHIIPPTLSELEQRLISEFKLRPDQAKYITTNFDPVFIYKKLHEIVIHNADRKIVSMGAYTAKVFGVL